MHVLSQGFSIRKLESSSVLIIMPGVVQCCYVQTTLFPTTSENGYWQQLLTARKGKNGTFVRFSATQGSRKTSTRLINFDLE